MKNTSIIFATVFLLVFTVQCQKIKNNNKISSKEFRDFVSKFEQISLPFNMKKRNNKSLIDVSKEEATKYLHRSESSLSYVFEQMNVDTEEFSYDTLECLPTALAKFFAKEYIVLVTIDGKLSTDTSLITLYISDYNGIIKDKCIIGEQYTREDDWISSIIENEYHFKIFRYSTNFENYIKQGGAYYIKNEEAPLTKVIVEDYEISKEGKINKTKTSDVIYLKQDILKYKSYYPNSDDPMNNYSK